MERWRTTAPSTLRERSGTGGEWGPDRTIRAEIIYALAVGTNPEWPTHPKGIQVVGARIVGALDFQGANISRSLVLARCYMAEPITLVDANAITVSLYGSHVHSLIAFRLTTSGSLLLFRGFTATDGVELDGASIGGDLDCEGGTLRSCSGRALVADGLEVRGSVFLRAWYRGERCVPFRASGEVRLLGARIRGDLDCAGAVFEGSKGRALSADRLVVGGDVCLRNQFRAKGEVRLLASDVGGNLDCEESIFENPGGVALNADSLSAGNVLLWRGFHAIGAVRLVGARINGDLNCAGGSFSAEATPDNRDGLALSIDRAQMRELLLHRLANRPVGVVSLVYATSGVLSDDPQSWPQAGCLWLDGFTYDTIASGAPTQTESRLDWLHRQAKGEFLPQPYEQLTRTLRRMGHERDARAIAIAKHKALRRSGNLGLGAFVWNRLVGTVTGYGYAPARALLWMVLLIIIGAGMFCEANRVGVMMASSELHHYDRDSSKPTEPSSEPRPEFQPVFYSIDTFLPFVDLHQKSSRWLVERKSHDWLYLLFQSYFIVHNIAGWLLTGFLVAAVTGIIRKD